MNAIGSLKAKAASLDYIMRVTLWPAQQRQAALTKLAAGHAEHHDDHWTLDCASEALCEALDLAGYAAIRRLRGPLSWRWWLVVLMASLQSRLLSTEAERDKTAPIGIQ